MLTTWDFSRSTASRAARYSPSMSLICSCQSKRRYSMGGDRVEYFVKVCFAQRQGFGLDYGVRFHRVRRERVVDIPGPLLEIKASQIVVRRHQVQVDNPLGPRNIVGDRVENHPKRAFLKQEGRTNKSGFPGPVVSSGIAW